MHVGQIKYKKVALWGLLIGNLLIGLAALFLWFSGTGSWNTTLNQKVKPSNLATSITAQAFAKQFASEYFSWNLEQEEDRVQRLQPFLVKEIDEQAGIEFSSVKTHARADMATVWKVDSKKPNQSIITVLVNVNLIPQKRSDEIQTVKRWLSIPIQAVDHEKFIVRDIPYLMPEPPVGQMNKSIIKMQGQKVNAPEVQQIQRALNHFFTIYSQGNEEQIRYLSRSKKPIRGYRGTMKFLSTTNVEIVRKDREHVAYGFAHLQETETHIQFNYPFELQLRKEKGQWYVQDLKH